jgi:phenylpropionate dioxygenase-like ring-hydroxylating dioxygenase large terminal subunit
MIIEAEIGKRELTTRFPELGTEPIPTAPYYDQAHFAREKERIFKRTWIKVGRVEQVGSPGDFFVMDLAVGDTSILITRDEQGKIRGFHNVCAHRGNKLVWEQSGHSSGFACRMHGWTYLPDGSLRTVPDENMFYGLDKSCNGLTPVATDVWQGFIFVNLCPEPEESLEEYLGEVGRRLGNVPFSKATARYTYRVTLKCNWKVALDAFTEGYHVVFVHGKWGAGTFTSQDNPFCQLPYAGIYGPHAVMGIYGSTDYQPRPTEAIAQNWGAMFTKREAGASQWLPSDLSQELRSSIAFDLTHVFPNFLIQVLDGTYFTHEFHPVSEDTTVWEGNTYYAPPRNAGERFGQEYAHLLMRENWLEDTTAMEAVQSMLRSGAKQNFILHDHELLPRHTFNVVMSLLNGKGT